jgi:hypothetical protein
MHQLLPTDTADIANYDFERGNLDGWQAETTDVQLLNQRVYVEKVKAALSGVYRGRVQVDEAMPEGKLYVASDGLEKGSTYQVKAYLNADKAKEARLFVEQKDTKVYASVVNQPDYYVSRVIEFKAAGRTAKAGLDVLCNGNAAGYGAIDNLTVEKVSAPKQVRYEAEQGVLTGGEVKESYFVGTALFFVQPVTAADGVPTIAGRARHGERPDGRFLGEGCGGNGSQLFAVAFMRNR